ncbi:MAG: putative GTPases (G3E family) [halophilic archaeon J07HX5]|nr:MAG: putative GTPases (G3E family) [halophilic archaeon J07HX5]
MTQAEHANVVLVNKCDRASEEAIAETEALLEALNPDARRYRTRHGAVEPGTILDTGLFSPESLSVGDRRERVLEQADAETTPEAEASGAGAGTEVGGGVGDHDHDHSHDEHDGHVHDPAETYGVTSIAFESRQPLHPERFAAFLRGLPDSVIRSKGLVWVAGRDELALRYTGTGSARRVIGREPWVAAMSKQRQETQRRLQPDLPWDEAVGDRRTELVFIGRQMDETALEAELAACELTDDEQGALGRAENPFPSEEGKELLL